MGRSYCTVCDDYGHAAEDHKPCGNIFTHYLRCMLATGHDGTHSGYYGDSLVTWTGHDCALDTYED